MNSKKLLFEDIKTYLTPYKLGKPVLTGSGQPERFDAMAVDCPFVFYHNNCYHMLHVGFDGKGYQTGLAVSDDLINWESKGAVLKREEHTAWDRVGAAGTWIIKDTNNLSELPTLKKIDGKYWMIYHSYPDEGYENGAAQMGLAWTQDESLMEWHRLSEPVFSCKDGADWEKGGLYKACIIEEQGTYYLFYNAKNNTYSPWVEQTGVAFSKDLFNWERYEGNPVMENCEGTWESMFCSDPCVLRDGGKWVMMYFGYDGKHAQDGIAISDDLIHWKKYRHPVLQHGQPDEIDEYHAHKPSAIKKDGVLYHFYCACRKNMEGDPTIKLAKSFRCISVATSQPLK